jgi:hypothetical protein
MAAEEAMEPFMGMKVRRRSSMYRVFSADYLDVPANPTLVKLLSKQGRPPSSLLFSRWFHLFFFLCIFQLPERYTLAGWSIHHCSCCCAGDKQVLFADSVMKVNRKCKLVRRVLIVTDVAIYILDSTFYCLKHRIPLQASFCPFPRHHIVELQFW